MEMREKGKGELVWFSPERSSQWLTFLSHILVVELGLTGLTSTSRSSRTTCSKSLALLRSSVSVLSVRPRILSIKFWWLGYPCYDGPIAKAMDYTSKGELL